MHSTITELREKWVEVLTDAKADQDWTAINLIEEFLEDISECQSETV